MHLWAIDSIHNNKPIVILENIRSCYNVGNIIRTADALGWSVYIAWYTPSPHTQPKVKKTPLGAEESVLVRDFLTTAEAIDSCRTDGYTVIAAEVTDDALSLGNMEKLENVKQRAVVLWNEVVWVEPETLASVDAVVKIPMRGAKESLNVWQTAAIFMWELGV